MICVVTKRLVVSDPLQIHGLQVAYVTFKTLEVATNMRMQELHLQVQRRRLKQASRQQVLSHNFSI